MGAARARDVAAVTGRKTAQAKRAGVSEYTDRAHPDGFEDFRRTTNRIDNPIPGEADLSRFRPLPGRILVRQQAAWESAKHEGIIIPDIADVHRGQRRLTRYTVLRATPCRPEAINALLGPDGLGGVAECTGGCWLEAGDTVLANAHTGASLVSWAGPGIFLLRCRRVVGVVDGD